MTKPSPNKWIVVVTVITAALLQLIDTSIVNVTLTQMMGNLGASLGDISWVVTAYAAANVVMITLSGWLSSKFGRKNYFTASIILFTAASIFCGTSTSVTELIIFRIIQGIGGGGLLSTGQAIIIDTFSREELGKANAIFGMGVILGPSIGPSLGGYITDHLSWHWVFFINVPIGIIATTMALMYVKESEHNMKTGKLDWLALIMLIITIGALQVVLEKGESEDWFESRYITVLTISFVLAAITFVYRQLTVEHPILNLRLLKSSQFSVGTLFSFIQGIGIFASVFVIPVFCQTMLGYNSQDTGNLLLPGSLMAGVMMPVTAVIMKKTTISPVALSGLGLVLFIVFVWQLSGMSLNTGPADFFWPLILRGVGLGLLFIPLMTITIYPLANKDIGQGTALTNTVRQLGGSFGIATATTFIASRSAFHFKMLNENVSMYNSTTYERFNALTRMFVSKGSDVYAAQAKALTVLKGTVMKQAMLLTYNDVFLLVGIFFAMCIPLLLLFKTKKKNASDINPEESQIEMVLE
jgi:MFS transporter, DHA2 family, multidrug resistance protein